MRVLPPTTPLGAPATGTQSTEGGACKRVWGPDGQGTRADRGLLPGGWSQAWPTGGVEPYMRSNGPHPSTCRTRTHRRQVGTACSGRWLPGTERPPPQQAPVRPGEWLAMRPSPHSALAGAVTPPQVTAATGLRDAWSPASVTRGEASPPQGTWNVRRALRARRWPHRPAPGKAGTRTPGFTRISCALPESV